MTTLDTVVPVSRRVLDSAVMFGTLTATAIAIVIMAGIATVAARVSPPGGETTRMGSRP